LVIVEGSLGLGDEVVPDHQHSIAVPSVGVGEDPVRARGRISLSVGHIGILACPWGEVNGSRLHDPDRRCAIGVMGGQRCLTRPWMRAVVRFGAGGTRVKTARLGGYPKG
jgi:hypothetical protein